MAHLTLQRHNRKLSRNLQNQWQKALKTLTKIIGRWSTSPHLSESTHAGILLTLKVVTTATTIIFGWCGVVQLMLASIRKEK